MTDTQALVERIARFVEGWNGDTRDGDTFLIAEEIRAQFASAPPVGETSALVEKLERGTLWERMERGNADCLGKRRDGEPMFIILGRDPDGAHVVRYWAQRRRDAGDPDHAAKAFAVAELMAGYSGSPDSAPPPEAYPTALRKPAEPVGDEELAKIVHENGPVVIDAMGEGLAWRPLDYGTWTELAALSSTPERGWQPIETAPHACHVIAARFDRDAGEWIYGFVLSPPSKPFTHWRMPPEPPTLTKGAIDGE